MTEQKIEISIIIPCRNEEKYIGNCIASLLNQSISKDLYEILVVDGKSTDNTLSIVNDFIHKGFNIRIIDNPQKITPVAMNLGIKSAKGKFVAICGAHAVYDFNYLEKNLKLISSDGTIKCTGGPIISEGENDFGIAVSLAMSSAIGVGNAKHRFPEYNGEAEMACFPFFKKEIFDEIGLYDEKLVKNQDDDLCFRIRLNGGKIFLSPDIKSTYFVKSSPKKLFEQYFNYGYWRWAVLIKHKKQISYRQMIPSLFLIIIFFMFLFGLIKNNFFIAFIIPIVYLITILCYSIFFVSNHKFLIKIHFTFAIIILHISYGWGFIKAFFDYLILKKK